MDVSKVVINIHYVEERISPVISLLAGNRPLAVHLQTLPDSVTELTQNVFESMLRPIATYVARVLEANEVIGLNCHRG
jgi:hypothetical protein